MYKEYLLDIVTEKFLNEEIDFNTFILLTEKVSHLNNFQCYNYINEQEIV